jgi:hypothetical protein
MLFSQAIMTNFVLTKSSGPKRHAVLLTVPILPVSVCVTHILVGGGAVAIAAFPPPPAALAPHSNLSLKKPSFTAVGRFAHRSVGNSASPQAVR